MAVLHLVNRLPPDGAGLATCFERLGADDAVVLMEQAVYACRSGSELAGSLRQAARGLRLYALEPDLSARGIFPEAVCEGIEPVDFPGLVALCCEHDLVHSW
jgi:sulfur relay protein TusB/DsrH